MKDEKKKKQTPNSQPTNPELERENEEKEIEAGKKDFNDAGGFPRPPLSGGLV
ncbi:MAG: hypothetical protein PHC41_13335 [Lachnospiraceae bacterium]|jgi:hypothetical protein|nr:hypothetical protein [Lachnospiraceae bacterium]MDD3617188.1 hypothetical protein [Lachnospiraceae bacterium]